jgi:NDP-sugar pyrophosphorylase family protein
MKLFAPADKLAEGFGTLGWPTTLTTPLAIVELLSTILYLIPRTSILGAILLTGYMGGAIAAHVRIGDMFIAQAAVGVLLWGGLFLRYPALRQMLPVVKG